MLLSRVNLLTIVLALAIGTLGALVPGCYADWAFVRDARLQQASRLQQQLKTLADENEKLKAQLPQSLKKPD